MTKHQRKESQEAGNVIDSATGVVDPPPRKIRLRTLRDVRRELARLYNRINEGEISTQDGSRRAFVLRQLADCITVADLEKRLADIEGRQMSMLPVVAAKPALNSTQPELIQT